MQMTHHSLATVPLAIVVDDNRHRQLQPETVIGNSSCSVLQGAWDANEDE